LSPKATIFKKSNQEQGHHNRKVYTELEKQLAGLGMQHTASQKGGKVTEALKSTIQLKTRHINLSIILHAW
jgi:hypothetical protein